MKRIRKMLPPASDLDFYTVRGGPWKLLCWIVGHRPEIIGGRGLVWQACERCERIVPLFRERTYDRHGYTRIKLTSRD